MARELAEETGLTGTIEGIVGVNSILVESTPERPGRFHGIRVVYDVSCTGDPVAEQNGSTDLAAWIPLDDLDQIEVVDLVTWALEMGGHIGDSAGSA